MDLVTFEDLTVNFTKDEWALLDSSQKNLYREVVGEIFVTSASVGERWDQNIEDWYRNQGRILSSHIKERLGDSRTFSQILDCDLKKKSSTEVKLCECSVCGTVFTPHSSRKPSSAHPRQEERDYKCQQCEAAFSSSHVSDRSHTEDKACEWQEHEEAFLSFTSLGEFAVTGTECGPHKCNVCGKGLQYPSSLRIHERIHTGEKPYQCEQCGQAFSCWGSARRHQRNHTGEKPYKCRACGKAFSSLSGLKGHVMRPHDEATAGDLTQVRSVGKSLIRPVHLVSMKELTRRETFFV